VRAYVPKVRISIAHLPGRGVSTRVGGVESEDIDVTAFLNQQRPSARPRRVTNFSNFRLCFHSDGSRLKFFNDRSILCVLWHFVVVRELTLFAVKPVLHESCLNCAPSQPGGTPTEDEIVNNEFEAVGITELTEMDSGRLDEVPFGVIGFTSDATVTIYNATESKNAGLSPQRVLGKHFFGEVAPCMNNFMIAQRFDDEEVLDDIISYVLTLRMRPTPVRLRLLKAPGCATRFVLIERTAAK
jgi:photoactive yellow protein